MSRITFYDVSLSLAAAVLFISFCLTVLKQVYSFCSTEKMNDRENLCLTRPSTCEL